jgi:hypothetical protein
MEKYWKLAWKSVHIPLQFQKYKSMEFSKMVIIIGGQETLVMETFHTMHYMAW